MTSKAIEARTPRHLLDRLLDAPDPTLAVQRLEPRILHQLIRTCGLEDCGQIVALATPEQLMQVFDEDLWRSEKAGKEDQFDPDRFGLWLEVLVDAGVEVAAQKLAQLDFDFVTAAISRHIFVLGAGSMVSGRDVDEWGVDAEIGGYRIIARRSEGWDALTAVLVCLEDDHQEFFQTLMKRCFLLSTDYVEDNGILYDVLAPEEQIMSDVAFDRERRREEQGYVTPAQAVAFLESSRHLGQDRVRQWHHSTLSYFRERGDQAPASAGGWTPPSPDRLLPGQTAGDRPLAALTAQLRFVHEHDEVAYAKRVEELGYLANVLMAGCSFDSRRLSPIEASEAVAAVCNLGLESWWGVDERREPLPQAFLAGQDLVAVFRIGWSVIYEQVCLQTARRLVRVLSDLACDDAEVQEQIADLAALLKRQIAAGTPWRARDSLDVIAILDTPTWSTLLGLVDECPVVPKQIGKPADATPPLRVASDVEFISENRQVSWVREFLEFLPSRLAG
jgi:uncharacterized protein DUF6178